MLSKVLLSDYKIHIFKSYTMETMNENIELLVGSPLFAILGKLTS
jgi:hypothetical protein